MTIYAKKGILYLGYKESGKWKYKSSGLPDTKENRKKLYYSQTDEEPKLLFPPFSVLAKEFLATKNQSNPKTIAHYKSTIVYFETSVGEMLIRNINETHIDGFKQYLFQKDFSIHSIASHIRDLRIIFAYFLEKGYIDKNFVTRINPEPKQVKVIPQEKLNDFIEYLRTRNLKHYRFIKFLSMTGLRISEAVALKWEDVQFENNRMFVSNIKRNRTDSFPLNPTLKNFLFEFQETSGSVFGFKNTNGLHWLKKLMKKKLPTFSYHDIRRTFATRLLTENVSPYKVMKLMRHKDFKTTMRHYAFIETQELGDELERVVMSSKTHNNGQQSTTFSNLVDSSVQNKLQK